MESFFGNRKITIYASGTAALSRAIAECATRSQATVPEVILPAYGCPDLVAACRHASVFPRLVDVSSDLWGYDHEELERWTTKNTIAIVTVNLLGIGDDAMDRSSFCRSRGVALIQDSAQHLPRTVTEWPGDYVVLSFGRGKPLNLLHGGALVATTTYDGALPAAVNRFALRDRLLASRFAATAFNWLTRPGLYGILSVLPGTGLGAVVYKPLADAHPLGNRAERRVDAAFDQYRREQSYRRGLWAPVLDDWRRWGIAELRSRNPEPEPEPLRLALLAPDERNREALVRELVHAGLGASRFYGAALPEIRGVPEAVRLQGPFPNATRLAARLLTLPTHALVTADSVRAAHEIVRQWHRRRKTTWPTTSIRAG